MLTFNKEERMVCSRYNHERIFYRETTKICDFKSEIYDKLSVRNRCWKFWYAKFRKQSGVSRYIRNRCMMMYKVNDHYEYTRRNLTPKTKPYHPERP